MSARRSLRLPIVLAIVMIVLLLVLTVGWVLVNISGAVQDDRYSGLYWATLTIGSLFIAMLVVGTVLYLILSVKAINLTRRQSNFIDSVTHELKSPIASMKLYLQTLSRHHVSPAEQTDFYRFMLEDLERLDRLINQMLAAGRVESEPAVGPVEDIDLAELLRASAVAVCMSYRVPAETVQLDLEPCRIRARPLDLEIMFRNLIDNAGEIRWRAAAGHGDGPLRCQPGGAGPNRRQRPRHPVPLAAQNLRPLRAFGIGIGTREAGDGTGLVYCPHVGTPAPR